MDRYEEKFQFPKMTEKESFEGNEEEWEAEQLRRQYSRNTMNKEEKFHYILGAVAGALAVAGVFLVVFFLFLLFATKVWLK